jgi:hypothetical protein
LFPPFWDKVIGETNTISKDIIEGGCRAED